MRKLDYAKWQRKRLWTLVEAACLLSGKEPMPVDDFLRACKTKNAGILAEIYDDLKDALSLNELKFKESRTGHIGNRRVKPGECVTWASKCGYDVPEPLQSIASATELSAASETTYIKIISALLGVLLGKSPAGNCNSVFKSQAAIIDNVCASHPDQRSLGKRTLEKVFAQAKRELPFD
jgi:hypothetical protein